MLKGGGGGGGWVGGIESNKIEMIHMQLKLLIMLVVHNYILQEQSGER